MINVGIGLTLFGEFFSIFMNGSGNPLTLLYVYVGWVVFFVALIIVLFILFTGISCISTEEGKSLAVTLHSSI